MCAKSVFVKLVNGVGKHLYQSKIPPPNTSLHLRPCSILGCGVGTVEESHWSAKRKP